LKILLSLDQNTRLYLNFRKIPFFAKCKNALQFGQKWKDGKDSLEITEKRGTKKIEQIDLSTRIMKF